MANEGHIIVKGKGAEERGGGNPRSVRRFYIPAIDKGNRKPAFCAPRKFDLFREETDSMQKALDMGQVDPSQRMEFEADLKKRKTRLNLLEESRDNATKIVNEDRDMWVKRRGELATEIANGMPSRRDMKEHRVNPHTVLKNEKQGGLEEKKIEYQIISQALGEDSSVARIERER